MNRVMCLLAIVCSVCLVLSLCGCGAADPTNVSSDAEEVSSDQEAQTGSDVSDVTESETPGEAEQPQESKLTASGQRGPAVAAPHPPTHTHGSGAPSRRTSCPNRRA